MSLKKKNENEPVCGRRENTRKVENGDELEEKRKKDIIGIVSNLKNR